MAHPLRFGPWSPSRPFPVHTWLAGRFSFRLPHPPPPTCPRPSDEQRRDLELHLLVSCLPPWLRAMLLPTLCWEAKRRVPWSQERCAAGAPLLAQLRFPTPALTTGSAAWLRALLVSECEIGLTTIQTPLAWLSRPARNHALALRAARLGQLAAALERCPDAGPLSQEAEQVLAALRR
ncbi:MAG TPA: hypothetical protein VFU69_00725 [Ktedonobacterales bacterium]|nr:hypothetical protein [Ktedonobacterales bacterium]